MTIIPATIENISTRKDKTVKVTIGTQELSPTAAAMLLSLQNKLAFVAIQEAEFQPEEIKQLAEANADLDTVGKSSSERLRGVLYKLFVQSNEGFHTFDAYYRSKMEKIIDHFKSHITI